MEDQQTNTDGAAKEPVNQQPSDQQPDVNQDQSGVSGTSSPAPDQNQDEKKSSDSKWEFDGNYEKLREEHPEQMKYAQGIRRYLTRETQAISEDRDKVEKYDALLKDPQLYEFLEYKKQRVAGQPAPISQPAPQADLDLDDPDQLKSYINSREQQMSQQLQQYAQKINQLEQRVTYRDREAELQAFADTHPEFWQLRDLGLIQPKLKSIVDSGKGTITDAFNSALDEYQKLKDNIRKQDHAQVTRKKNASSAKPSAPAESETEYITPTHQNWSEDVMQRAMELAAKGIKKQVKRKK